MFFKKERIIKEHERNELRLIDEVNELKKENTSLNKTLEETTNNLIDAKRELGATNALCKAKDERMSKLEEKNRKLASSVGGFKSNYTRLKNKIKTLERENRELKYRAKPFKAKDLELYQLTGRKFNNGQKVE